MNADELMKTKMNEWPYALQDYTKHVCHKIGFCGEVLYTCCEDYVNAGAPPLPTELIDAFDTKLARAKRAENTPSE